jgi:hypothetical protein
VRFRIVKFSSWRLGEFFKKPVEFKLSLGKLDYGSFKVDFETSPPAKQVTPAQAAEIPETIRYDSLFLITPKKDFTDGTWRMGIDGKWYEAYHDAEPRFIEDAAIESAKSVPPVYPTAPGHWVVFGVPGPKHGDKNAKVSFQFLNDLGETIVTGEANTKLLPPLTYGPVSPPPHLFNCTPKILQGRTVCVCGFFPTVFSQSQLLVDGKPLGRPLSGATDMVVFQPENLAPGKHVISWNVAGFDRFANPEPRRMKPAATEQIEFVVLLVQGSIDQNKLLSGQRTDMHLRIIGTDEKLPIELENTTPNVIELEGGIKQVVNTSGGSDNNLKRGVKAQKTGMPTANFNINYRLTLTPCPCNPGETEKAALGGTVTKPPNDPPGDQPKEPRKDCELILLQYNALSVEYGKLQTDIKRVLDSCDRFDDGTIAGRNNRDRCRVATGLGNLRPLARADQLREQMLDLLAAYRECRGGN